MLLQDLPFLSWLHLHGWGRGLPAPNMRDMIPESAMLSQMRLHFLALAMLLLAVLLPGWHGPAGLLFAASSAWFGINLVSGLIAYLRCAKASGRLPISSEQLNACTPR